MGSSRRRSASADRGAARRGGRGALPRAPPARRRAGRRRQGAVRSTACSACGRSRATTWRARRPGLSPRRRGAGTARRGPPAARVLQGEPLLVLPLEEESCFLRQCSEKFRVYADILKHTHGAFDPSVGTWSRDGQPGPLMAAAAEALERRESGRAGSRRADDVGVGARPDPYVEAPAGRVADDGSCPSNDDLELRAHPAVLVAGTCPVSRRRAQPTVIDQEPAVRRLCDEFSLFAAGTRDQRKPPAYFLVGPTGVGKNHLVESSAAAAGGRLEHRDPDADHRGPELHLSLGHQRVARRHPGLHPFRRGGILTTFHETSARGPRSA